MDFPLLCAGRIGVGHLSSEDFIRAAPRRWGAPGKTSDAAALGRADAIVRDRRHVADRRDVETDGLQRAERRFTAGAGALRSEERRVGKECVSTCSSRWSPSHSKKKKKSKQQTR